MNELKFWKVESVGNHFPLFEIATIRAWASSQSSTNSPIGDSELDLVWSQLAIHCCRNHFGIGGDGILAVEMEGAAVRLRMFNPDGTEDFCGNGIRCAARFAHSMNWVGNTFTVLHRDREIPVTLEGDSIRTELPAASYDPKMVPTTLFSELFNETVFAARDGDWPVILTGSALTTGSTHVVIPTGSLPDDEGFASISSKLEVDPRFPVRTSVIWAARNGQALKIRIWERGAGETQGCGTGSSAAAIDWMRRRKAGGRVEVQNPGGTLYVEADRWDAPIRVEGPANILFEGVVEMPGDTAVQKMGPTAVGP